MWRADFPYGVGKCPHGGQGGGHCVQKDEEIYDYHLRLKAIEYLQVRLTAAKRLVPATAKGRWCSFLGCSFSPVSAATTPGSCTDRGGLFLLRTLC